MIKRSVDALASQPLIFNFLRRVIENNFRGEKKIIREHFLPAHGETILDIGCGTGEFSTMFDPERYTGIDIEPRYVEYAKKKYPGSFMRADARTLPFAENSFDKVLVVGMFHHLDDETSGQIFSEMKRVLKKGGTALVMEDVHRSDHPWLVQFLHKLDKGEFIRTEDQYTRLFSRYFTVAKRLAMQSGLSPYQVYLLTHPS